MISYTQTYHEHVADLWEASGLQGQMSKLIFHRAITGYYNLRYEGKITGNKVIIVDFRQSSKEKRLYIIDISKKQLIYRSKVAHGVRSGNKYAIKFSNEKNSWESSLGFFATSEKYNGNNGISLRLDGLDPGYNDNARDRNIVIHGADYVDSLYVGHSKGCIAIPKDDADSVINMIKGKQCLFVYNRNYKGKLPSIRLNEKLAEKYYNYIRTGNQLYELLTE